MMRLFIGLAPTDTVRTHLCELVSGLDCGGRLMPRENYHLTLAFLGMREEARAARIQPLLDRAAKPYAPLRLTVREVNYFGKRHNALLYAALAPSKLLQEVSDTLRGLLAEAGETFDEKPFVPHITLARKVDLTGVDLRQPIWPFSFTADRLTLFHSTRVENVLRYLPIAEAAFPAAG